MVNDNNVFCIVILNISFKRQMLVKTFFIIEYFSKSIAFTFSDFVYNNENVVCVTWLEMDASDFIYIFDL